MHTQRMESANIALRLMAVSQVLLFMGIITFSKNPCQIRFLGGGLMLAISCYLTGPLISTYISEDLDVPHDLLATLVLIIFGSVF